MSGFLGKVLIAYPHVGGVSEEFAFSLAALCLSEAKFRDELEVVGLTKASGCMLPENRNKCIENFLSHPRQPEWLLFIDTDIAFPVTLVHALVSVSNKCGAKIMAAPVWLDMEGGHSNFYTSRDGNYYPIKLQRNTLYELAKVGSGILLVHRSVFEEMATKYEKPWQWFCYVAKGDEMMTDDFGFCRRALDCGFKLYGYTGVSGTHLKTKRLEVQFYDEKGEPVP